MCIRDRFAGHHQHRATRVTHGAQLSVNELDGPDVDTARRPVSYTHLRAHETVLDLVCRLLLEKKKKSTTSHVIATLTTTPTDETEPIKKHNVHKE